MAKKILGISFGNKRIKLVEVEQLKTGPKVVKWAIEPFPSDGNQEQQAQALTGCLKKNKISASDAVVTIRSPLLLYKLLELPVMQDKEIPSAMNFKLESLLPFPVKDAVINYYRIPDANLKGKSLFFVAAISKKYVREVAAMLSQAGIRMINIIPFSSALNGVLQGQDQSPHALISIGQQSTVIVLVKNGRVVFAREFTVGGASLAHAMEGVVQTEQGKYEIDFAKAEELKRTLGIPLEEDEYLQQTGIPASRIMAMMRPALEKIGAEILRTFEYYRNETGDQTEFLKFYMAGSLVKTKNLLQYFKRELELEILPFSFAVTAEQKDFVEALPLLALSLGAALTSKDYLDLLPEEYKHPWLFRLKKIWSYWFVALVYFLIILSFSVGLIIRQGYLETRAKMFRQKLQSLGIQTNQAVVGGQEQNLLTQGFNQSGEIDRFVVVMNLLNKNTPSAIYFRDLTYDNNSNSLRIKGLVLDDPKSGGLISFIEQIRQDRNFKNVDLASLRKSDQDADTVFDFEINCLLVKEAGQL